jgi:DNA-binding SARP family transcriptional activator
MAVLRIRTLGPFQITLGDDPIPGITSEKMQGLLAYLGLQANQPLSREMVSELLWPERPPGVARRNLRQALKRLQGALPGPDKAPHLIRVEWQTLQFNSRAGVWLDVAEFTDALTFTRGHIHRRLNRCRRCAGKLAEAAALYRGDFLEGIITDSPPLDDWILLQREWLRREALGVLCGKQATGSLCVPWPWPGAARKPSTNTGAWNVCWPRSLT